MASIAAFDFDGTLTRRDCMVPFLRQVAGSGALVRAVAAESGAVARRDRDALKAGVVRRLLAGRSLADLSDEGSRFAAEIVARRLRPDTVAILRRHQEAGDRTVLVSASLRPYLDPVAAALRIDHVICTELETRDGVLTGELVDGNCRGPAKATRLQAWLGEHALEVWAYGDSSGDNELLALAAHGVRV
ncbi:MAG TPA: HAD family hydrolase [Acidimicrobiales bacterium]|jgi:phosphatidylglycerophosphatase C|nr:HAD family hydrolase [Acidimicrobiales bacterium]